MICASLLRLLRGAETPRCIEPNVFLDPPKHSSVYNDGFVPDVFPGFLPPGHGEDGSGFTADQTSRIDLLMLRLHYRRHEDSATYYQRIAHMDIEPIIKEICGDDTACWEAEAFRQHAASAIEHAKRQNKP